MKKGLWLAVVLAAGCGTPPTAVQADTEGAESLLMASKAPGISAKKRGSRLGQERIVFCAQIEDDSSCPNTFPSGPFTIP